MLMNECIVGMKVSVSGAENLTYFRKYEYKFNLGNEATIVEVTYGTLCDSITIADNKGRKATCFPSRVILIDSNYNDKTPLERKIAYLYNKQSFKFSCPTS